MISANIDRTRGLILSACGRAGRPASDVTLIAVGKTFPADRIAEALAAGVADIGENYVQELLGKHDQLAPAAIRWHFIGHLQSNKVRQIAGWVHLIHAVDSESLAREIDRQAERAGRTLEFLVEVNTTGEQSKFGVRPDATAAFIRRLADLPHITITGLMTMGPFLPDPEGSRPMFRELRRLKEEIARLDQPNVSMRHLSMGMSGDFEVAIEEGSTLIRLGTAIFGPRLPRQAGSKAIDHNRSAS